MPQQLFQIQSKAALEGLSIGDLIQGRVMAMENGMLLIRLLDGSSFSASVPEGFSAPAGTQLTLQIGEPAGDQITARIVRMDIPPQQEAEPESQASQIARQLQALGGKNTDALVSKVLGLLEDNPGLNVEEAVFLTANGMESDQAMLETVVKLAKGEFNISSNLQTLGRLLADSLSETDKANLETLLKPLLFELETEQAARDLAGRLITLQNEASREDMALGQGAKLTLYRELLDALEGTLTAHEPRDRGQVLDTLQKVISALKPGIEPTAEEGLRIPENRLEEALNAFIDNIERNAQKTEAYFKPESPQIRKIIDDIFEKVYIRMEDGNAEPIDLNEKTEILKKVLNLATESARLAGGKGDQAIRPVVQDLSNALRFFDQVNTYHVFVHIPLIINQQHTAGELYIMKRKSRKGRIDPNQFTLFISLNTQNLGLVETFLNASHGCVTIHFRVEDQQLADFVRAHYKELYEALGKKGYKLAEMKCRVFEDVPANLLNAGEVTESMLGMNTRVDLRI